jgi:hypothetical protein
VRKSTSADYYVNVIKQELPWEEPQRNSRTVKGYTNIYRTKPTGTATYPIIVLDATT